MIKNSKTESIQAKDSRLLHKCYLATRLALTYASRNDNSENSCVVDYGDVQVTVAPEDGEIRVKALTADERLEFRLPLFCQKRLLIGTWLSNAQMAIDIQRVRSRGLSPDVRDKFEREQEFNQFFSRVPEYIKVMATAHEVKKRREQEAIEMLSRGRINAVEN